MKISNPNDVKTHPSLCMSPWTHLHISTQGEVFPCCFTDSNQPLAHLDKKDLKEVFNQKEMRDLRKEMISGARPAGCKKCFEIEDAGGNSHRRFINNNFSKHFAKINETDADGKAEFFLAFWDFRFSNLCNYKCRTCGFLNSSAWYEETKKLDPNLGPPVKKIINQVNKLWHQLESHFEELEWVYFAGGEPLIMDEHWQLLDKLVEKKMFKTKISYSTNLSVLKFKNYDALEYWKKFESIHVWASLDATHERGEYIRKGQQWTQILENRKRLMREAPEVHFTIIVTLSVFNIYHITDFHKEWTEQGLIPIVEFVPNLLFYPTHFRIQILTRQEKEKVLLKINDFLAWAKGTASSTEFNIVRSRYESIINFLMQQDLSHLMPDFLSKTKALDVSRQEDFTNVFPELTAIDQI